MFSLSIMTFLKSPAFKYLIAVLAVVAGLYFVYHKGQQNVQEKWDADKILVAEQIKALNEKAAIINTAEVIKYVDRVKTVTVKGDTITQYVDRFITAESDAKCVIPKNFILLYNAAVTNTVPDTGEKK
jgi:archaellum component FlaF (FlaF/FlaG flagellin family)